MYRSKHRVLQSSVLLPPAFSAVLQLLVNFVGMELLFTWCHRWLHSSTPHLHVMHHALRTPSWTSNLLFHPLDLAAEFTGPLLFNVATYFLVRPRVLSPERCL